MKMAKGLNMEDHIIKDVIKNSLRNESRNDVVIVVESLPPDRDRLGRPIVPSTTAC